MTITDLLLLMHHIRKISGKQTSIMCLSYGTISTTIKLKPSESIQNLFLTPWVPIWRTEYVMTFSPSGAYMTYWVRQNFKRFSQKPGTREATFIVASRHPRFGKGFYGGLVMSFCSQESLRVTFSHFRTIFVRHLGCWTASKEAWLFFRRKCGIIAFLLQTNLANGLI